MISKNLKISALVKLKKNGRPYTYDDLNYLEYVLFKKHILSTDTAVYNQRQLYIHIPFCSQSRCKFCVYRSDIIEDQQQLDWYLDDIEYEMTQLGVIYRRHTFQSLYIGGGTASLLTVQQFKRLFAMIHKNFRIDMTDKNQTTVELSPNSIDRKKIDLISDFGINRVSMGVQSVDPRVLTANNRKQVSKSNLAVLINYINQKNFVEFNVDLMTGIEGRTLKNLIEDFEYLADLGCKLITVYIDMNIYRDQKQQALRDSLIKDIKQLYRLKRSDFIVNDFCGEGKNRFDEYNFFIRRGVYNHNYQYFYNTDSNTPGLLCLGIGKFSITWTDRFYIECLA